MQLNFLVVILFAVFAFITPTDDTAVDATDETETVAEVESEEEIDLDPAPEWIESAPQYEGELHTATVACGPYLTLTECQENLPAAIRDATDEYVQWYLAQSGRSVPRAFFLTNLIDWPSFDSKSFASKSLVSENDVYDQTRQFSYGPMITRHVRLRFDKDVRQQIDQKWKDALVAERLTRTGAVAATLMGICGLSYVGLGWRCRGAATCRR